MLKEGITVLDSGCGPATWTLDMCKEYLSSKFHVADISDVFPQEIMPPNITFVIGNIAEEIPYPDNTFDFIYQRLFIVALTAVEWEKVRSAIVVKSHQRKFASSF